MIPVQLPGEDALDARTRKLLAKRQGIANGYTEHDSRIDPAWKGFRKTQAAGKIATLLAWVFHGKCAYCEQELAKDIEHYFPKSRFPDRMFLWENFLWACKNCDTEKLDEFPLDADGAPVLIHPGRDEPFDYFRWNFRSGKMILHPDPARGERARQTRDLLGLDQFSITDERRNKFENVRYLLARVVKEDPVAEDTIARLRDELAPHRPWLSVIRQLFTPPNDYSPLVAAARAKLPELDIWLGEWNR
jgi:uncharacterized protein (TIGR02646 family)